MKKNKGGVEVHDKRFEDADSFIRSYIPMIDFLAEILGKNSEVVLNDIRNLDHSIIAIRNNYISHRHVGDPASDLVLRISKENRQDQRDFIANYQGRSEHNAHLRSSTYFLKYEGEVVAMICINTNEDSLNTLSDAVKSVLDAYKIPTGELSDVGADEKPEKNIHQNFERLTTSADAYAQQVVDDYVKKLGITKEFMKPENKIDCVRQLNDHGYFQLKDSVEEAAKALGVSEPSVYRYIQTVRKEK